MIFCICCVCVTFVFLIYVGCSESPGLYPFWITESTISRRWRRWSKTGSLHIVWIITDDPDWAVHRLYTQEEGNSWWSSRRTWRSTDMWGKCLRFRSDLERTCKWTMCLTLDIILCDWWISVAWSGLPVWHAKMQMIKAFVEKQSLVVDDQSTGFVA